MRLKRIEYLYISIPLGSIKSVLQAKHFWKIAEISIPLGSIKSILANKLYTFRYEFQFH